MDTNYLFKSERLLFCGWTITDIELIAEINAGHEVMRFSPGLQNYKQTIDFVERMQQQLANKGYCYFSVDKIETAEFIGFIGLSEQTYAASFTPCTDIGWRLCKKEWDQGYATEGAKECLRYAFNQLNIRRVNAMAQKKLRPERIMKRIGMKRISDFIHPALTNDDRLKDCVLYDVAKDK